ncbi:MAG: phosphate/phosphite/phosphonate ABC transporter substrate-binding protein [Prochlorothrix sp.]|nr:phosphate/phosphite/phosphonate ABC transporter substrate-binding protein [Prochlorothrix sp.]
MTPWTPVKHWIRDRASNLNFPPSPTLNPHLNSQPNPQPKQHQHPNPHPAPPPDRPHPALQPHTALTSHRLGPRSNRFPLPLHPSIPLFALALGACTGSPAPNSPAASDPLTFGILSTEAEENQRPLWEPFLEAMATSLGQPVEGFYAQQYSDLIEGLKSGTVEVAWMGGKAYIDAAQEAGAEAFALTVAADGSQGYTAHLIARQDQPWLQTAIDQGGDRYILQNAPNLTFAFNDPQSTSGFLVPNYYIFSRNGVQASDIFAAVRFEGDHEATALAVVEGRVDVATNNSEALARFAQTHPADYGQIAVIWTSQLIPGDPIVYDGAIDEDLKATLRDFFYSYQEASILQPLDWSAFKPADDTVWNPIRVLDLSQQIEEVRNNSKIGETERQTILDQLNQQIKTLDATPALENPPAGETAPATTPE